MARVPGILMLVENDTWPSDQRIRNEATALHDAGFQVSIICPKGSNQSQHQESYSATLLPERLHGKQSS